MRRHAWLLVGLLLLAVGTGVLLGSSSAPDEFGWSSTIVDPSFQPEHPFGLDPVSTRVVLLSQGEAAGILVITLGLLVLAAGAGYRLGRRGLR